MAYIGDAPSSLRILDPTPKGSILNDRGYRIAEYLSDTESGYEYDAFSNGRGVNGQLYDIGAEEFEGRMHISDIEFVMISEPSAYKSGSGAFDDAEYIITTLPIEFKVILRNSGNLFQSGVNVRIEVTDLDVDTDMRYYDTVITDVVVSQSKGVVFDLPDDLFKTYTDLEDLGFDISNMPGMFDPTMKPNVTPRYSFKIEIQADEKNSNNYGEVISRFYIRRSNTLLKVISAEYSNADIYDDTRPLITVDEVAGRLNYEALESAFIGVGYYPNINKDIDNSGDQLDSFKIDVKKAQTEPLPFVPAT